MRLVCWREPRPVDIGGVGTRRSVLNLALPSRSPRILEFWKSGQTGNESKLSLATWIITGLLKNVCFERVLSGRKCRVKVSRNHCPSSEVFDLSAIQCKIRASMDRCQFGTARKFPRS